MKSLKKSLSVFLAVLMLVSSVSVLASAKYGDYYTTTLPTVYLCGQGTNLWETDENGKRVQFYPVEIPDGYIGDAAKTLIEPLADGIITDKWDNYAHALAAAVNGIVSPAGLNENGEAKPGQGTWTNNPKVKAQAPDGTYYLYAKENSGHPSYYYNYDWRLDPYAVAKELRTYIEGVKAATGHDKVNLIGRCLGANIALAYIDLYGTKDIAKVLFYSAGLDSFEALGCLFSGKLKFNSAAMTRFIDSYLTDPEYAGEPLYEFANSILLIAQEAEVLGVPLTMVDKIYKKIKDILVPEVLLTSYATMPGFWAMVGDDYYEDAKQFLFGGQEDKYAGLIEKIDNYHYNVERHMPDLINKAMADGSEVYIMAKYGLQMVPTIADTEVQSDTLLETRSATLGATCSDVTKTLSKSYIAAAEENGTAKYISVDKKIDASTGILPDHTWFIKNLSHLNMPSSINVLIEQLLSSENYMTVFDDENFPQYMFYNNNTDTLEVLTKTNGNAHENNWNGNIFVKLYNLIKRLFILIADLVDKYIVNK